MNKPVITKVFILFLVGVVTWAVYLIFQPFLVEILAATILVSIFYRPYEWLVKKFKGRKNLAALTMCFLVILIVIIPLANLIVYTAQRSVIAYSETIKYLNNNNLDSIIKDNVLSRTNLIGLNSDAVKNLVLDTVKKSSNVFIASGTNLVKSTTSFLMSLLIIIFTMFFFFVDGPKMVEKIMHWTPLPNKYDLEIFKKFRDVSYSTMLSVFVTAIAQGIIGAIGFMIVGLPAFFAGIFMAFFSLLPYIGTAIIWAPAAVYLLIIGNVWQGVFMIVWGALVVGTVDNLIKAYILRGKAEVHPIFIIFSILGGISLFGFWGLVFGPLIISLAVTILHIYEMEYGEVLEK